jgi:hypothetical protein
MPARSWPGRCWNIIGAQPATEGLCSGVSVACFIRDQPARHSRGNNMSSSTNQLSHSHRAGREGGTRFDNLEAAMRFYRMPVGAQGIVRETLGTMSYDELWVPPSRCYVGVGHNGVAIAWVHKTKISIRGRSRIELPGYADRTRTPGSVTNVRDGEVCPRHWLAMPIGGNCPDCD